MEPNYVLIRPISEIVLLKLAQTLALVALGVMLLHALPAFCEESNQISLGFGMTSSDGCVADDACCASGSFVHNTSELGLGMLDVRARRIVIQPVANAHAAADPFEPVQLHLDPDLSTLGKLNI